MAGVTGYPGDASCLWDTDAMLRETIKEALRDLGCDSSVSQSTLNLSPVSRRELNWNNINMNDKYLCFYCILFFLSFCSRFIHLTFFSPLYMCAYIRIELILYNAQPVLMKLYNFHPSLHAFGCVSYFLRTYSL